MAAELAEMAAEFALMAVITDVKLTEPPPLPPAAMAIALLLMFLEFTDITVALLKIDVVLPTIYRVNVLLLDITFLIF